VQSLLYAPLLIGLVAAGLLAAILVCAIALARLRGAARRLAGRAEAVRRHPLVGEIGPEPMSPLADLEAGMQGLVDGLREEVRRAHERAASLRALSEGPADLGLIGLDAEWIVLSFSRGAVRLTGWPVDEISGRHVEALFAPGEWERLLVKLARKSVREEGFVETVRILRRDGGVVPCGVSVGPGGSGGGTLLVARDLSAEQELEHRLRVSEERHRRLVEEVQDGVVVLQEGRIAYVNPALAQILGTTVEGLRTRPFKDLLDTRDLLRVLDLLGRAERGEEARGETSCRLAVAGQPPVEARLTWSATEYRERRATFCTVADLSARGRSERAIAESEARLRAALDAAGDPLALLQEAPGGGWVVAQANRAFGALLPAGDEGPAGRRAADLFGRLFGEAAAAESLTGLLAEAGAGSEARRSGVEILAPGRSLLVDLVASPVRATGGAADPAGVVLTLRDVTARAGQERALRGDVDALTTTSRELERSLGELAEARASLQERNAQLERLNGELRSLDEMKSNLLANVSHELHTPLVSIKGYTEMILKRKLGPLTPEQERGLLVAQKNIDRLIELIDNLLSFARLETGETQLRIEDVPLFQLVDEAIELVSERLTRRNISITTQYEGDDLVVRGDRVKIGQVFTNLLTNAVKFNRDGGRIAVAARRGRGGFVEVEVADTGIGIPSEEQEKIFERFYQVEAGPRRRYEGTGIGLAIVRDILRLHGGSIRVQSTAGQGSTFQFTLPLGRKPDGSTPRPQSAGRNRTSDPA
jgi:PAS domain S-box-containing protein